MLSQPPAQLQAYNPALDRPGEDEAETGRQIDETMGQIRAKTFEHSGHAIRSVHAKSHGLLKGELTVADGLHPALAQGLFATPGRYPVILRFSTVPGDLLADSVSTPRGVAIKIVGVSGDRVAGSDEAATQDFIMVNGPAFKSADAKGFLSGLKLVAATTDRAEGLKKVASAVLRGAESLVELFGTKSATLLSLGGQPETHILGDTFFTQLPVRYGGYIAKLSLAPLSPNLKALTDAPLNVNGKPDGLREAVVDFFGNHSAEWEVRVQLCTNFDDMPIEPANKAWDEAKSPYLPVGTIVVGPQIAWSEARSRAVDDGMGFNPWNALEAHRPLGSLMRIRLQAYRNSQQFRSERNATPVREPETADLP